MKIRGWRIWSPPSCLALGLPLAILLALWSHSDAQMQVEKLNRGLIAVRQGQGYYLSWRLLADEPYTTGFNVYRGATKLNAAPITGATLYSDANGPLNSVYTVRAVVNGAELPPSGNAFLMNNTEGATAGYLDLDLQRPPNGPRGGGYSPGDASAGDLDGDGEYEIVLKWDPSNAKDNAQDGLTDPCILDAYKLDGTRLWRINLGLNIRSGAHYTQFMVYDFDGDGRAEMMVKTAPGTRDGTGNFISMGPAATASHSTEYHDASDAGGRIGRILSGPEYLTVFDGRTGKELATADYHPSRGNHSTWGDNYGNRVDRFLAAVAYVDGRRPSAIFCRGYYTRTVVVAWDWRDGRLTRRWVFDTSEPPHNVGRWTGQGNHQVSVIDADNDGKHDIIYGAVVIGSNGVGLHTSGLGHGDALHVAHMIKGNPIPQVYMPHESGGNGVSLRHANTGTMIFNPKQSGDIGRGVAAELDPAVPGFKFWGSSGMGLYDMTGARVGGIPNSVNFLAWWDGDLSRELLNGNTITKWNVRSSSGTNLLSGQGSSSVNGTKSTPNLSADLFGDWREEVILTRGSAGLRIYTSVMPTRHRLVTLMHDPTYRVAVAWQNTAYNQPPHPGYYIASDMPFPPPALNVAVVGGTTGIGGWEDRNFAFRIQNVPNSIWGVNFTLDRRARVELRIHDFRGRLVGAPHRVMLEKGEHTLSFQPFHLANGTYHIRLKAGNKVAETSLVHMR